MTVVTQRMKINFSVILYPAAQVNSDAMITNVFRSHGNLKKIL